jgi:uncharacterized coiled-coil protein SlyX
MQSLTWRRGMSEWSALVAPLVMLIVVVTTYVKNRAKINGHRRKVKDLEMTLMARIAMQDDVISRLTTQVNQCEEARFRAERDKQVLLNRILKLEGKDLYGEDSPR